VCQLIVKPKNSVLPENLVRYAWNANNDGAGIAIKHNNKVEIIKGLFKLKHLLTALEEHKDKDLLVHLRYATHGEKNVDNTHPFILGDSAIGHNGVLSKFLPMPHDKRSDTRILVDDYLNKALEQTKDRKAYKFLSNPAIKFLIQELIGTSKLAALTPQGFIILNEELGVWHEGIWYSAGVPTPNIYVKYGAIGYQYQELEYNSDGIADIGSDFAKYAYEDKIYTEAIDRWEHESMLDTACTICLENKGKLYQVGVETVCSACWDVLYMPQTSKILKRA